MSGEWNATVEVLTRWVQVGSETHSTREELWLIECPGEAGAGSGAGYAVGRIRKSVFQASMVVVEVVVVVG